MYLMIILFVIFDQIVKYLVVNCLYLGENIEIIKNFFSITYVENDGAAFSILSGSRIFFILLGIGACLYIIKCSKNKQKIEQFCYYLLISGILGNLIDRVINGYVIDYLDFYVFGYNFPVFNFADICITVGAAMLLVIEVLENGKNHCRN